METLIGIKGMDIAITALFLLALYFIAKKVCKILDRIEDKWEREHNLDYRDEKDRNP